MSLNWRAVAAVAVTVGPGRAHAAEPPVPVPIVWVETGLVDRFVSNVGLHETRDVLKRFGILVTWRSGPPSTESGEEEIRIVPLARRLGEKGGRRILAATTQHAGPRTVWLDWAGIIWLAGVPHEQLASAPPLAKRRMGVALGRVLAHEVIHALVPDLPHADRGLMSEAMRESLVGSPTVDARSRAALLALAGRRPREAKRPDEIEPSSPRVLLDTLAEAAGP